MLTGRSYRKGSTTMIRSTTCPWAGTFPAADDIIYCDLTLREGEQSPGVS